MRSAEFCGLAERALADDATAAQALTLWLEEIAKPVLNSLPRARLIDGHSREDFYQSFCYAVLRDLRGYRPERGPPGPWAQRILRNLIHEKSRRDSWLDHGAAGDIPDASTTFHLSSETEIARLLWNTTCVRGAFIFWTQDLGRLAQLLSLEKVAVNRRRSRYRNQMTASAQSGLSLGQHSLDELLLMFRRDRARWGRFALNHWLPARDLRSLYVFVLALAPMASLAAKLLCDLLLEAAADEIAHRRLWLDRRDQNLLLAVLDDELLDTGARGRLMEHLSRVDPKVHIPRMASTVANVYHRHHVRPRHQEMPPETGLNSPLPLRLDDPSAGERLVDVLEEHATRALPFALRTLVGIPMHLSHPRILLRRFRSFRSHLDDLMRPEAGVSPQHHQRTVRYSQNAFLLSLVQVADHRRLEGAIPGDLSRELAELRSTGVLDGFRSAAATWGPESYALVECDRMERVFERVTGRA